MINSQRYKILGVIPARLNSTRFPRKVLLPIAGRPMLFHVYTRARQSPLLMDLLIATDSDEIFRYCESNQLRVLMTSQSHTSGTARLYEVMTKIAADIYVNIQGDEPMVTAQHLELLLRPFVENSAIQVITLKTPMNSQQACDVNCVKVVTDTQGNALYFSRSPIPYHRMANKEIIYFKHLGFYAYTKVALQQFQRFLPAILEQTEGLEQLRFLENGIPIHVVHTDHDTIGVDTEDDLRKVEEYFKHHPI